MSSLHHNESITTLTESYKLGVITYDEMIEGLINLKLSTYFISYVAGKASFEKTSNDAPTQS